MENVEQLDETSASVGEQITSEIKGDENVDSGSTLGKFKDATSLLNAYNSLEKEFTRKSQKLAELTKVLEEQKTQNEIKNSEKLVQNDESAQNLAQQTYGEKTMPQFNSPSWRSKVRSFLDSHPDAKDFFKPMAEIILNDKQLATLEGCLEYSYNLAKAKANKPADLNNPATIESLAKNDKIKKQVISSYLTELKKNKTNLAFITGEPKIVTVSSPDEKPKNLKEASNYLKKMLNL